MCYYKEDVQTSYLLNNIVLDIYSEFALYLKIKYKTNDLLIKKIYVYIPKQIFEYNNCNCYNIKYYKIYKNKQNKQLNINFLGINIQIDNSINFNINFLEPRIENYICNTYNINRLNLNTNCTNISNNALYHNIIKFLVREMKKINFIIKKTPKKYNNIILNLHFYYSDFYNTDLNIITLISLYNIYTNYYKFILYVYSKYVINKSCYTSLKCLN
jgi:hypothetical protein